MEVPMERWMKKNTLVPNAFSNQFQPVFASFYTLCTSQSRFFSLFSSNYNLYFLFLHFFNLLNSIPSAETDRFSHSTINKHNNTLSPKLTQPNPLMIHDLQRLHDE